MIATGLAHAVLPLEQLKPNELANVVDVVGEAAEVHRLSEMGLGIGTCIRMIRPGAPCLLALDGKRLSLRLGGRVDILVAALP